MPKLKILKENGIKLYPITITRGVYDIDNKQNLAVTISNIHNRLDAIQVLPVGTTNDTSSTESVYGALKEAGFDVT